jgi:hypothetical protein
MPSDCIAAPKGIPSAGVAPAGSRVALPKARKHCGNFPIASADAANVIEAGRETIVLEGGNQRIADEHFPVLAF